LELLGGELAGLCANKYAITVVLWHTFLLSGLMVTLEAGSQMDDLKILDWGNAKMVRRLRRATATTIAIL